MLLLHSNAQCLSVRVLLYAKVPPIRLLLRATAWHPCAPFGILLLYTRIELTGDQQAFAAMGSMIIAEHAYDERPTFICVRNPLTAGHTVCISMGVKT